jgi:hypothetical protein
VYLEHLLATAEELIAADLPLPLDLVAALLGEGVDVEALS